MGYRDDFYVVDNVIGYSGNLLDFPTVYFQSGSEYGHITQKHDTSQNVGRGRVKSSKGYTIENRKDGSGTLRLFESVNGKVFHASRGILTSVGSMTEDQKAVLYQAIWQNTGEKYIDGYNDEIFDAIDDQREKHGALMQQFARQVPKVG
jgi:hypothetical protein